MMFFATDEDAEKQREDDEDKSADYPEGKADIFVP